MVCTVLIWFILIVLQESNNLDAIFIVCRKIKNKISKLVFSPTPPPPFFLSKANFFIFFNPSLSCCWWKDLTQSPQLVLAPDTALPAEIPHSVISASTSYGHCANSGTGPASGSDYVETPPPFWTKSIQMFFFLFFFYFPKTEYRKLLH